MIEYVVGNQVYQGANFEDIQRQIHSGQTISKSHLIEMVDKSGELLGIGADFGAVNRSVPLIKALNAYNPPLAREPRGVLKKSQSTIKREAVQRDEPVKTSQTVLKKSLSEPAAPNKNVRYIIPIRSIRDKFELTKAFAAFCPNYPVYNFEGGLMKRPCKPKNLKTKILRELSGTKLVDAALEHVRTGAESGDKLCLLAFSLLLNVAQLPDNAGGNYAG